MLSKFSTILAFLVLTLLLPSHTTSQSVWDKSVNFSTSKYWPPESCVRSCLTGAQCTPCEGYSLTTWVGCTTNRCLCNHYDTAFYYLAACMILNCGVEYVTTDPYNLIYNYCVSTGEQDTAAAGGKGGSGTVTTTFTARPSQTPTETPVVNPYDPSVSATPPKTVAAEPQTAAPAEDKGLTRSDKIALGVGLGVGIPSAIAAFIVIYQFCSGG